MRLSLQSVWVKFAVVGLCMGFVLKAGLLLYAEGIGERVLLMMASLVTGAGGAAVWLSQATRGFVRGVHRITYREARALAASQTEARARHSPSQSSRLCLTGDALSETENTGVKQR